MKRTLCMLLAALLLVSLLVGCGGQTVKNDKKSIVVTVFPIYDWIVNLLGDKVGDWDVTFLLDNGVDLHSYQPTAEDMVKIVSCDLFVYVGGTSDKWVADARKGVVNTAQQALNLMELLGEGAKEEELVEGMQGEEEEEEAEGKIEYDEHVWLSLRNTELFVSEIAKTLSTIDPENASVYAANSLNYLQKLAALDAEYRAAVQAAARTTVLFGDRFPFRYLTDDYGLRYYAAFVGCSAEAEASFETVIFLAGKVDELQLPVVLTLEGTDHSLAQTIIDNTESKSAAIVTMDSMQSTTKIDAEAGASYLAIMEQNLAALTQALN